MCTVRARARTHTHAPPHLYFSSMFISKDMAAQHYNYKGHSHLTSTWEVEHHHHGGQHG